MSQIETAETIFGSFEHASMPLLGINSVVAKIDTGAYSGALHCSLIKVRKDADNKRWLTFVPLGDEKLRVETDTYEFAHVRSSTGHRVKRYLVETEIVIKEKSYRITIGLSDRSDMQNELLIGRRFLREHNILVDTRMNQHLDKEWNDRRTK